MEDGPKILKAKLFDGNVAASSCGTCDESKYLFGNQDDEEAPVFRCVPRRLETCGASDMNIGVQRP